jgi:hypothetical protein
VDSKSEDHGSLGVRVLKDNKVLAALAPEVQDRILQVIGYHNKPFLPDNTTGSCLLFTKLLRDADKLDVWHTITEYYHQKGRERIESLELEMPDAPEITDKVCENLLNGKIALLEQIKTLNDFKLLQMGWVYDINFPRTAQLVKERKYLEKIMDVLPDVPKVREVYKVLRSSLKEQIATKAQRHKENTKKI